MSVRFVVGRAGAGKTFRAIESIRTELRASPRGDKLLLLVPEQATLQTERALVGAAGLSGMTRAEVWSFRRLARGILAQLDPSLPPEIDAMGRQMVLRHIVGGMARQLTVFGSVVDRPGYIERLAGSIVELFHQAIPPSALLKSSAELADYPSLAGKLSDLGLIYQTYLDWLRGKLMDPEQYLDLLLARLDEYPWLPSARLWVEGFAGFTGQEQAVLVALVARVKEAEISFLIDPDAAVLRRPDCQLDELGLFVRTERTYCDLLRAFQAAGVTVEPTVRLTGPPPRFAPNPELVHLESHLFSWRDDPWPETPQGIHVVEAANRRDESDAAAREIRRLVRREGLRYRDIAIVVRDLEPYHDLLTAALYEHHIPFFIDRRQPISHHPLIELLRTAVAAAESGWGVEPMRLLLKSDLLGMDRFELDGLENYVVVHGVHGEAWFEAADWDFRREYTAGEPQDLPVEAERAALETINAARRALTARLSRWHAAVRTDSPTGRHWAVACWALLEQLEAAGTLAAWAQTADREGRVQEADEHREVWHTVIRLLDSLAAYLGDEPMDIGGFRLILEASLAGLDIGLVPPTLDQVLIGSIERSRHPEIKALLVLGFSQESFPQAPPEDPIFRDAERRQMVRTGLDLGPGAEERFLDERMLAYIAMTRPSKWLWISYPSADGRGRAMMPSPYLASLRHVFPRLQVEAIPASVSAGQAPEARPFERVATITQLAGELAARIRATAGRLESAELEVYEWARSHEQIRPVLARIAAALGYENRPTLDHSPTGGRELRTSVSRLESFAACPFQHFARHILDLELRPEYKVESVDLGNLYHHILAEFTDSVVAQNRDFGDLTDAEIAERVGSLTAQAATQVRHELLLATARNRQLAAQTERRLAETLRAGRLFARAGRFRPDRTEWSFGLKDGPDPLPPLSLTTPKGRGVVLYGRIDRVDVVRSPDRTRVCVVDYKRAADKRLSLDRVYHGLDLQLPAYLIAIGSQRGPTGAFYVSLSRRYQTVKHPDEIETDPVKLAAQVKPRGIFDADALPLLDADLEPGEWSPVVQAYLNKNGGLGHRDRSDAVEAAELHALLAHVKRTIGRLADEIIDGRIDVQPYFMGGTRPCNWCEMRAVCRFEPGPGGGRYNPLPTMRPTDVLTRVLAEAQAAKGDGDA